MEGKPAGWRKTKVIVLAQRARTGTNPHKDRRRWLLGSLLLLLVTALLGAVIFRELELDNEMKRATLAFENLNGHLTQFGLPKRVSKDHAGREAAARSADGDDEVGEPAQDSFTRQLREDARNPTNGTITCANESDVQALIDYYEQRLSKTKQLESSDVANIFWSFSGSLYYTLTLMTTVGYGTFVPQTDGGRAMTVVFGFFGVLVSSFCLGTFTATFDDWLQERFKRRSAVGVIYAKFAATSLLLVAHVLVLALFGSAMEDWPALISIYYSFVTISTIGLGDYSIRERTLGDVVAQFIFIFPGLILFAEFTNLAIAFTRLVNEKTQHTLEAAVSSGHRMASSLQQQAHCSCGRISGKAPIHPDFAGCETE